MDPLRNGFSELEKAFTQSPFSSHAHGNTSSIRLSGAIVSRPQPPEPPSDQPTPISEGETPSSISTEDDFDFSHASTTSPSHRDAAAQDSGFPPTPPTMTNSDVAEPKAERHLSPQPLFVDRVRSLLEQRSQPSTPIMESQSPPTPDPSPPRQHENRLAPRPELPHYSSSFADSFKTATEGRSGTDSSRMQSPFAFGEESEQDYTSLRIHTPLATVLDEQQEEEQSQRTPRQSVQYLAPADGVGQTIPDLSEESDRGEVRAKNYQMESDSDWEAKGVQYLSSDEHNTSDDLKTFSSLRRTSKPEPALNHRLWKPFQPGDEIKRPDPSLVYGSSVPWRSRNPVDSEEVTPKREMDTEFLRTSQAETLAPEQEAEAEAVDSPAELSEAKVDLQPEEMQPIETQEQQPKELLREFAPTEAPTRTPSPPNTRARESLDENNKIYRFIREENAKRHSAISDGSVQCMVLPSPENKRKLRHTPKRESLRCEVENTSNSKRSSTDSSHKLRHKRAMPSMGNEATPDVTPSKAIPRSAAADVPLENGYEYCPAIPEEQAVKPNMAVPIDVKWKSPEKTLKSRKLRRSVRELDLDRRYVSNPETRPWSGDAPQLEQSTPSPRLRRVSHDQRLYNNTHVRRTSLVQDDSPKEEGEPSPGLRRSSNEQRLESSGHVRRTSISRDNEMSLNAKLGRAAEALTWQGMELPESGPIKHRRTSSDDKTHATSPRRKSFDPRFLHATTTPASVSQFSGTEAELCEARGIELFPHNNDSLLVIQQASQPSRSHRNSVLDGLNANPIIKPPSFHALVQAPSESQIGRAKHGVDSPLTNPRPAPDPPAIQFIPPTPNEELERTLYVQEDLGNIQRRLSLAERVRRYSESLIQPLPFGRMGSLRRSQQAKRYSSAPEERPNRLSPFWQPRDFWEEYDSSDSLDDLDDDHTPLPAGGDTSNVPDRRRSLFPRNMSVRMPGFRGKGGFLVGNSLGMERHGTNVRRHYVDRKTSEEMLRRISQQSLRERKRRVFTLPFSNGMQIEYVGLTALGSRMRWKRRERAAEKRREALRGSIGTRVYHGRGIEA